MIKAFLGKLNSSIRLYNGAVGVKRPVGSLPSPTLELYEYEASPWCKKVRECINILGLKVNVKPCPRETFRVEGGYSELSVNRKQLAEKYGKERLLFPCLVDVQKNIVMNESSDIVECKSCYIHIYIFNTLPSNTYYVYPTEDLWDTYGDDVKHTRPKVDAFLNSQLPRVFQLPFLFTLFPNKGVLVTPTKFNAREHEPLLFYSCEPSVHGRFVREALSSLQIHYTYIPTPCNSHYMDEVEELQQEEFDPRKHFVLIDPNCNESQGAKMFFYNDSAAAIHYLYKTYQAGERVPFTNTIVNNLGRSGSFREAMIKNILF